MARLRAELKGRRVIRVGSLSGAAADVEVLRGFGVAEVLLVGYGTAAGDVIVVDRPVEGLQALSDAVAENDEVARRVGLFDPGGSALVMTPPTERASLWRRRTIGVRRDRWRALEDKTTIDALWDQAGVRRAPSRVVPAELAALQAAAAELDAGAGTVWSGDPSGGIADSASLVFRVTNNAHAQLASQALTGACRRARVMPYLEGVACSIHAILGSNGRAAVFRPVEIVTLRRPDGRFLYAGTSTWWDPPADDRDEMRNIVRRVAGHLSRTLSYRGPFGIDGILTTGGFLPTELNSRWTAGFYPLAMVSPLPLGLLADFVSSGLEGPFDQLEAAVVAAADTKRWGGPTLHHQQATSLGKVPVSRDGTVVEADRAAAHITVTGDPGDATVLVRPHGTELLGESVAPLAARLFTLCDQRYGTKIGPITIPPRPTPLGPLAWAYPARRRESACGSACGRDF